MSIQTIDFKNTEADLAALGRVCKELEDKGLPPNEAAAHVLASMANQAMMRGMDPREAIDALHQMIAGGPEPEREQPLRMKATMTPKQVEELHNGMDTLRDILLYWDMVLCVEIQRYAYLVLDKMKEKGLYRHELKQYVNRLSDEARRMQMRIKDNDHSVVTKWCNRIDKRGAFVADYYNDGASVVTKLVLAFQHRFKADWNIVLLDCKEVGEAAKTKHKDITTLLFVLSALTNTGVDLFDACIKRMKRMMQGKGSFNIRRSTHHESMRNAVNNLIRKMAGDVPGLTPVQQDCARRHLADMQTSMVQEGLGDFFKHQFEQLASEFARYMMARMRMEMEQGRMSISSIRCVYYRLGTSHRVKKFFKQLSKFPLPEGDCDVWDVMENMQAENYKSEMTRFSSMCEKDDHFEQPESGAKQESRMLRVLARRNNYMLPDDILRVMVMKHGTKTEVMKRLTNAGFELAPTLRRVRRMKAAELKQL